MQDFIEAFFRHPDGTWTCIAPATLEHPQGRIQVAQGTHFTRGTIFMGVDLVEWLEQQYERDRDARGG
ncbi:MAG: hypothetical protein ACT4P3_09380 [Betaproteobacteria bacterium]